MTNSERVCLVVGGTKGIGRAVSLELARSSARTFANYAHDGDAAAALEAVAAGEGTPIETIASDVSSKAGVDELVDRAVKEAGHLDVIVFAAVDPYLVSALEATEERWWQAMRTNAAPFLWLGQRLAETTAGPGRLIAITSPFSRRYVEGYAAVGPSKAALESLVVYLAAELAGRGITVNAVSGGLVDTELLRSRVPEKALDAWARRTPVPRLGRPGDITSLVAWLAGDESEWMTGQVLTMDGGYFLR
jgi:NAD(P)-dependent dehydrogenase (short-subunit alcohol dehydrogenase family)